MSNKTTIKCPNCNTEIDVNEILYYQLEEKRSLMASWKRRQKLIDGVLTNTTEMYGQGIAGSAIGHIPALELPYNNVEIDNET